MDSVLDQIGEWLKELLVSGIMNQLTGLFDSVNTQVGDIATQVGTTPANFSPGVFAMIRNVSESVIIPVAGLILTFIACYELIQMIIDHNNLANFETWIFFKWVFKTFVAVTLITNTFNIVMAVFDVTQHVINNAGGLIAGNTAVDAAALETMQDTLEAMEIGPLFALFPVSKGRERDWCHTGHQVDFDHSSIDDNENHNAERLDGKLNDHALQEQCEQRSDFHGFQRILHGL